MKTKLFFALAAFSFAITANAQKPFKELGLDNEVEVLTLSNGRYVEYFTYDTLRQIGSVMFNTVANKIEFFIPKDDTSYMAKLHRSKEVSRFLSVDPLAKRFPFYTPYQYAGNSPIAAIDLDGLESFVATKDYSRGTINIDLVNAEGILSVTWSEQDKETQTQPLQISEVQKFVYNVQVNKSNGTITLPATNRQPTQTFDYVKYQQDKEGNFIKDNKGNLIPIPGNELKSKSVIESSTKCPCGVTLAGGRILGGGNTNNKILSEISPGQALPEGTDYDVIEVYIKPELQDAAKAIIKTFEGIDMNKVTFVNAPQNAPANDFEFIYKVNPKPVEEIK